jgi:hypothetical protein
VNPVTQQLLAGYSDPELAAFVQAWDSLEALVIRIYRNGAITHEDDLEFAAVRRYLRAEYPRRADQLTTYWQRVKVKGVGRARHDPFLMLLDYEHAFQFINDWGAMRLLPAIRQALNEWLMDGVSLLPNT